MRLFWIIPLAVIICFVMGYTQFHDMGIEAQQLVSNWDCDEIEYWLEWDGKKIVNNLFRNEVQKQYEVKCI